MYAFLKAMILSVIDYGTSQGDCNTKKKLVHFSTSFFGISCENDVILHIFEDCFVVKIIWKLAQGRVWVHNN